MLCCGVCRTQHARLAGGYVVPHGRAIHDSHRHVERVDGGRRAADGAVGFDTGGIADHPARREAELVDRRRVAGVLTQCPTHRVAAIAIHCRLELDGVGAGRVVENPLAAAGQRPLRGIDAATVRRSELVTENLTAIVDLVAVRGHRAGSRQFDRPEPRGGHEGGAVVLQYSVRRVEGHKAVERRVGDAEIVDARDRRALRVAVETARQQRTRHGKFGDAVTADCRLVRLDAGCTEHACEDDERAMKSS